MMMVDTVPTPSAADGIQVLRAASDPGRTPVLLIHPGAVPLGVYSGLAGALPAGTGVLVADLERVPEYTTAAVRPELVPDLRIEWLGTRVLGWMRAAGLCDVVLVGWSFGGTVACDLVSRLPSDRVRGLIVLDGLAPVRDYTVRSDELDHDRLTEWFGMYLAAKRGVPMPTVDPAVRGPERLLALLDAGVTTGMLRPGTTASGLRKAYDAYAGGLSRNNRLSRRYSSVPPSGLHTAVELVRPLRGMVRRPGALGWDQVAAAVTVHECPGDHYSMLDQPEATALVARLCAERARKAEVAT